MKKTDWAALLNCLSDEELGRRLTNALRESHVDVRREYAELDSKKDSPKAIFLLSPTDGDWVIRLTVSSGRDKKTQLTCVGTCKLDGTHKSQKHANRCNELVADINLGISFLRPV